MLQATVVVTLRPNVEQDFDSSAGMDKGSDSSAGTDKDSDTFVGTDKDSDSSAEKDKYNDSYDETDKDDTIRFYHLGPAPYQEGSGLSD